MTEYWSKRKAKKVLMDFQYNPHHTNGFSVRNLVRYREFLVRILTREAFKLQNRLHCTVIGPELWDQQPIGKAVQEYLLKSWTLRFAANINLLDTADAYGDCHTGIGAYLHHHKSRHPEIISKFNSKMALSLPEKQGNAHHIGILSCMDIFSPVRRLGSRQGEGSIARIEAWKAR